VNQTCHQRENTPWLGQFAEILQPGARVLEPGCGLGHDAGELTRSGCHVTAMDLDTSRVRQVSPEMAESRVVGDVAGRLPFRSASFGVVVASLSLHYFTHRTTEHSIEDIARVLRPGGWLLCRVNAVGDVNFGYDNGDEVEPSVFRQADGRLKRFFDEPMLLAYLKPYFRVELIAPRTILQGGTEKRTLECSAQKR
jgi:SAM-dependent methyltransferase